jgi:imidazolonepropionase-like amidohydrolase
VPDGAVKIDGAGKFLMPGIAEMHGHLPHPNMPEPVANNMIYLFIANGVTTVRGMFGFPNHLAIREKATRGEILAPTIFAASPALSGQSVSDPGAAAALVREYKRAGYDFLKVHEGLSVENYNAIVTTAKEVGIRLGGHIPDAVGVERAIKAGQSSIEHLDGYLEGLEADDSPIRNADPQTRAQNLLKHLDEKKITVLAKATREAGVWNTPTMALWQSIYGSDTVESMRQRAELKFVPPQMVNQWAQQKANNLNGIPPAIGSGMLAVRDRILKGLSDAEAPILLGSDAPQLFSVPGFSLMREMQAMNKAGMTPYQILVASTRNPAIYLKVEKEVGTVEVGKRADLILLDGNPLKDIRQMENRAGVMVRGEWISGAEIKKRLDQIAAAYAAQQ